MSPRKPTPIPLTPAATGLGGSAASDADRELAELYDRFADRLYRAAHRMLASPHDAQDAVQEVFLNLVRTGQSPGALHDAGAYLFTALRHAAARIAERRRSASQLPDSAAAPAAPRDTPLSDALDRALLQLPPEQRQIIALKIDGELTFAEIASVLQISANTAASRYRYALEKLRTALESST